MPKKKINLRPHNSGNWRSGIVLDQRGGSYYVDMNGTIADKALLSND